MIDTVFQKAVAIVLQHEGGYVNDPSDHGGETNFGISQRQYPALDIKRLTVEQAKSIYATDFWLRYRINQLPDWASPKVLDTAVLCGPGTAIKLLQRALSITGDGIIGPATARACLGADAAAVMERYRDALGDRFHDIVTADPSQGRFLKGWLARAAS